VTSSKVRHILSLSGGKDSSALAVYMRDRVAEMEYVFCDTRKELAETYEYLDKLEAYLGRPIVRLHDERGFDHWLEVYGSYLPSSKIRWCTRQLKIRPFERYVGDDDVVSYVGIRGDEEREGYISTKPNIKARFPFKEDGIVKADVIRILEDAGLGLPSYYKWRSRSGCYFCFFQRKSEWAGLLDHHPDLFELAKKYEKTDPETGRRFTWSQSESLEELAQPERLVQIRSKAQVEADAPRRSRLLVDNLADEDDEDDEDRSCTVCSVLAEEGESMADNAQEPWQQGLRFNEVDLAPGRPGLYAWYHQVRLATPDIEALEAELHASSPEVRRQKVEAFFLEQVFGPLRETDYSVSVSGKLKPEYGGTVSHRPRLSDHLVTLAGEQSGGLRYLRDVLTRSVPLFASPVYIGLASKSLRQRLSTHSKLLEHYVEHAPESGPEQSDDEDHSFAYDAVCLRKLALSDLIVYVMPLDVPETVVRGAEYVLNRVNYPLCGRN
jgi:hypothetical protein